MNLGNTYMDWGGALLQASQNATAPAMQFLGARNAYERRSRSRRTIPRCSATTPWSCTTPGDTTGAITAANDAVAIKPDFAVVWFNLGNFYLQQAKTGAVGAKAKAIEAYNKYLQARADRRPRAVGQEQHHRSAEAAVGARGGFLGRCVSERAKRAPLGAPVDVRAGSPTRRTAGPSPAPR